MPSAEYLTGRTPYEFSPLLNNMAAGNALRSDLVRWRWGAAQATPAEYADGALMIEMVDAHSGLVLWREHTVARWRRASASTSGRGPRASPPY